MFERFIHQGTASRLRSESIGVYMRVDAVVYTQVIIRTHICRRSLEFAHIVNQRLSQEPRQCEHTGTRPEPFCMQHRARGLLWLYGVPFPQDSGRMDTAGAYLRVFSDPDSDASVARAYNGIRITIGGQI